MIRTTTMERMIWMRARRVPRVATVIPVTVSAVMLCIAIRTDGMMTPFFDDNKLFTHCHIEHSACTGVGQGDCYPGLTCVGTCQLNTEDPNAHAPSVPLSIPIFQTITGSFSMGTSTTQGGPVFVVVVVGLLGAALMTLYRFRHRGLFLHRHHYHEVEATATATLRMAV